MECTMHIDWGHAFKSLFFAICTAGAIYFSHVCIGELLAFHDVDRFERVTGKVTGTEVVETSTYDSETRTTHYYYEPRITYEYHYLGDLTKNSKIKCTGIGSHSYGTKEEAKQYIADLGEQPLVFVPRGQPKEACLDDSYPWKTLVILVLLILVVLGCGAATYYHGREAL